MTPSTPLPEQPMNPIKSEEYKVYYTIQEGSKRDGIRAYQIFQSKEDADWFYKTCLKNKYLTDVEQLTNQEGEK